MKKEFIKRGLIGLLGLGCTLLSFARYQPEGEDDVLYYTLADPPFSGSIIKVADQMPEFPGGTTAMMEYIRENLRWPARFVDSGVQGRVICGFVVNEDGSLSHIGVIRGIQPDFDREAVRVIQSMPFWKCGIEKEKPVKVFYTLPVSFNHYAYNTLQPGNENDVIHYVIENPPFSGDSVMQIAEQMPEFPGGEEAMIEHIRTNFQIPERFTYINIQGSVVCGFVVNEDGSLSHTGVLKGAGNDFNREAVRIIQEMPKWNCGKENGLPVKVFYKLRIPFKNHSDHALQNEPDIAAIAATNRDEWIVYTPNMLDEQPEFPGGIEGLTDYLKWTVKYPRFHDFDSQGRVVCRFIIHENGIISDVEIMRSVDPLLDEEAIGIISGMPKWTPGMIQGQAVKAYYHIPITFRRQY